MSKPAAIPFFGDAYLADTTHLTTEEHGAYFLLLLAAWRQADCDLPDDDKKLARIAGLSGRKWSAIRPTIIEFWTVENGRIYQARLRKERAYVDQKSESNRKSAEARWNKQGVENKGSDECGRISDRNAPPPPPIRVEEPNGSPTPPIAPKPKPDAVGSFIAPEWADPDVWADLLRNRKAKRLTNTATAYRNFLKEIEALADPQWPPGRLLESIVARGWGAVYDPRPKDYQNGNGQTNRNPSAGHRGPDRRDGLQRAIDRAGGFDQLGQPARPAGQPDAGDGASDLFIPGAGGRSLP